MKIGCDTGYFIRLLEGNSKAMDVWKNIVEGESQCLVSCVTLLELHRLALQEKLDFQGVKILLGSISAVCKVFWCDSEEKLILASTLSKDLDLPIAQSVILMTFVFSKVKTIYTTDAKLVSCEPGIETILL